MPDGDSGGGPALIQGISDLAGSYVTDQLAELDGAAGAGESFDFHGAV